MVLSDNHIPHLGLGTTDWKNNISYRTWTREDFGFTRRTNVIIVFIFFLPRLLPRGLTETWDLE